MRKICEKKLAFELGILHKQILDLHDMVEFILKQKNYDADMTRSLIGFKGNLENISNLLQVDSIFPFIYEKEIENV